MPFMTLFHNFDIPQRAGPARQFLLAGAALLLAGSTFAQTPAKSEKAPRILTVADSVQLVGSKISGGWREHASDGSWRRVEFVLDREAATIVFSDGKPGSRLPSVTHYAARRYASDAKHYASEHFLLELDGPPGGLMPSMTNDAKSGPGSKGSPATYDEIRIFPGTTPGILDKANQSSPIPDDVATRIREIGGDIKVMQQMADFKRISELGSAFDAAGSRAADEEYFSDRPGGRPRRSGGGWKDLRAGVGRDGRASESPSSPPEPIDEFPETTDADGNRSSTRVIHHADGSTTTEYSSNGADGSSFVSRTERDAHGNVTGGGGGRSDAANGEIHTGEYKRNPKTGEVFFRSETSYPDGGVNHFNGTYPGTPSEVPFSGRGGFDEAWMDKSLPWFMDAVYVEWKRKNDLVKSGGMISQPGRGEDPSPGVREGPRVGASAVTNCGDTGTNPCARAEGTKTDTRGRLGALTQPPRDVPTGGPLGGTGGPLGGGGSPFPPPNPQLKP